MTHTTQLLISEPQFPTPRALRRRIVRRWRLVEVDWMGQVDEPNSIRFSDVDQHEKGKPQYLATLLPAPPTFRVIHLGQGKSE